MDAATAAATDEEETQPAEQARNFAKLGAENFLNSKEHTRPLLILLLPLLLRVIFLSALLLVLLASAPRDYDTHNEREETRVGGWMVGYPLD